jgi:hypothetical protein
MEDNKMPRTKTYWMCVNLKELQKQLKVMKNRKYGIMRMSDWGKSDKDGQHIHFTSIV